MTEALNDELVHHRKKTLVNLASNEYWKVVNEDAIEADVLHMRFLDRKGGQYKIISFYARRRVA